MQPPVEPTQADYNNETKAKTAIAMLLNPSTSTSASSSTMTSYFEKQEIKPVCDQAGMWFRVSRNLKEFSDLSFRYLY
jgi:hypothetical protein